MNTLETHWTIQIWRFLIMFSKLLQLHDGGELERCFYTFTLRLSHFKQQPEINDDTYLEYC